MSKVVGLCTWGALVLSTLLLHAELPSVSGISVGMTLDQVKVKLGPSFQMVPFRSSDPAITFVGFTKGTGVGNRTGWEVEALNGRVVSFSEAVEMATDQELGYQRVMADVLAKYGHPTYQVPENVNSRYDLRYLYDSNHTLVPPFPVTNPPNLSDKDACFYGNVLSAAGAPTHLPNGTTTFIPQGADLRCRASLTFYAGMGTGPSGVDGVSGFVFTVTDMPVLANYFKQQRDQSIAKQQAAHTAQQQRGLPQ